VGVGSSLLKQLDPILNVVTLTLKGASSSHQVEIRHQIKHHVPLALTSHLSQPTHHLNLMPFIIYRHNDTLGLPRSAKALNTALNAIICSVNQQCIAIANEFGNRTWVVVLL
jgi:hypothetical protein